MLTKATAATQGQAPHLRQKYDILISTPLRLVHAIQQEKMELDQYVLSFSFTLLTYSWINYNFFFC
jgi:hypothetical protein